MVNRFIDFGESGLWSPGTGTCLVQKREDECVQPGLSDRGKASKGAQCRDSLLRPVDCSGRLTSAVTEAGTGEDTMG